MKSNIFTNFLVSHLNRESFDPSRDIPSVLENSCPANWIVLSIFQFLISFVWLLRSLFAIVTSFLCFLANFLVQDFLFGLPTFGPEWRPRFKLWSNRYEAALGRLPQPIRKSLKTLSRWVAVFHVQKCDDFESWPVKKWREKSRKYRIHIKMANPTRYVRKKLSNLSVHFICVRGYQTFWR